ncbi:DUF5683 domain-containing protein [Mucilaginibacter sp. AW1-3]
MKRYLLIIVLLFAGLTLKAQTPDTVEHRNKKDSANIKHAPATLKPFKPEVIRYKKEPVYHPDSTHSPHKAAMLSLYIPGAGQIYNRHGLWWRLPALYTGLGLLAHAIVVNNEQYHIFLKEAQWREQGRPLDSNGQNTLEPYPQYNFASDAAIVGAKDGYRRNRDLSIFSFVAVWGINIVDAYVEAKFIHSYTMDDNLSFKISPGIINQPVYASNFNSTFIPTLKITLLFK